MDTITKYVNGDFSEGEFEIISEELIYAKLDRDKKRDWTRKLKEEYGVEKSKNKKKFLKIKGVFFILTLAASFLLLLSIYFLMPKNPEAIYKQALNESIANLDIMSDQIYLRKGGHEVDEIKKKANLFYSQAKYEESIQLWGGIITSGIANETDYFYMALCHLRKIPSAPDKSITFLLKSRNLDKQLKLDAEISWVLSLAYLKAGVTQKGTIELREIIRKNEYKTEEAKKLIELLKNLE